jgi:glycosyltransferase involved in cell wall biosynthesis
MQACEELARHHDTTLLCFQREDEAGREEHLSSAGVKVRTIPWRSDQARGMDRLALIADRAQVLLRQRRSDRPFMVEKYDRPELRRAIDEILDSEKFDAVQVEYSFLAPAAHHARRHGSGPAVLLNTHEIASLPRERELERARGPLSRLRARRELDRWRALESTLPDAADRVLCVTEQDRQRLARHIGSEDRLATVPLGYRVDDIAPAHTEQRDPARLLFVGSFAHPPNLAGARILIEEIMPLVSAVRPDIRLDVVGRGADARLIEAAERHAGRVRMHGFVANLDPLWARCSIFVAPLFTGGGIKIKVLEAMARGACIVSTPIGVEGIDETGEATTIAGSPEDFAARILDLATDPERRAERAINAREKLVREFSWASIVDRLTTLAREVLDQSPGRQSGRGPDSP